MTYFITFSSAAGTGYIVPNEREGYRLSKESFPIQNRERWDNWKRYFSKEFYHSVELVAVNPLKRITEVIETI